MATIISYRAETDQASHFLNVDELVKTNNFEKIKKVYSNIFNSATAYEPAYVESLKKLEEKLYNRIDHLIKESLKKIINDNKGWKAIGLWFLTLGIRPLIFHIKKNQLTKHQEEVQKTRILFSRALAQMEIRAQDKILYPEPTAIENLEKSRLKNLNEELGRLKLIPRIAKSLTNVNRRRNLSINQQVALGHSLELCEQLKDTHYVINHGQNLNLMIVNIVARKLKQVFEPQRYKSFETLRHNTALSHIVEDVHTAAWFQNQISRGRYNDESLRKELICGDCVLESTGVEESAIDFFTGRKNIANRNQGFIKNLLTKVVRDYIPNQAVAERLCNNLANLLEIRKTYRGGNLYSICVPKEKFNESCYFSRAYGYPLNNQAELRNNLEAIQSGEKPSGYPQIRILTHKIRPQDGYNVILNSTLTSDQLLKLENEVSICIQAALTAYRVQKKFQGYFVD